MKIWASLALCLVAGISAGETVVEPAPPPVASSPNVRIAVVLDGKPVKNAKVEFDSTTTEHLGGSVLSNDKGIAKLPTLKPGVYRIAVSLNVDPPLDYIESDLYLQVSSSQKKGTFSIDLTQPLKLARDGWAASVAASESKPVRDRVRTFHGSVQDPIGTAIPGTTIKIVRKGTGDKLSCYLIADTNGHFSAQLADGVYVAFFSSPGFRTEIVPVEVTRDLSDKKLIITLMLGGVT